jgi:hypothetical protein
MRRFVVVRQGLCGFSAGGSFRARGMGENWKPSPFRPPEGRPPGLTLARSSARSILQAAALSAIHENSCCDIGSPRPAGPKPLRARRRPGDLVKTWRSPDGCHIGPSGTDPMSLKMGCGIFRFSRQSRRSENCRRNPGEPMFPMESRHLPCALSHIVNLIGALV